MNSDLFRLGSIYSSIQQIGVCFPIFIGFSIYILLSRISFQSFAFSTKHVSFLSLAFVLISSIFSGTRQLAIAILLVSTLALSFTLIRVLFALKFPRPSFFILTLVLLSVVIPVFLFADSIYANFTHLFIYSSRITEFISGLILLDFSGTGFVSSYEALSSSFGLLFHHFSVFGAGIGSWSRSVYNYGGSIESSFVQFTLELGIFYLAQFILILTSLVRGFFYYSISQYSFPYVVLASLFVTQFYSPALGSSFLYPIYLAFYFLFFINRPSPLFLVNNMRPVLICSVYSGSDSEHFSQFFSSFLKATNSLQCDIAIYIDGPICESLLSMISAFRQSFPFNFFVYEGLESRGLAFALNNLILNLISLGYQVFIRSDTDDMMSEDRLFSSQ